MSSWRWFSWFVEMCDDASGELISISPFSGEIPHIAPHPITPFLLGGVLPRVLVHCAFRRLGGWHTDEMLKLLGVQWFTLIDWALLVQRVRFCPLAYCLGSIFCDRDLSIARQSFHVSSKALCSDVTPSKSSTLPAIHALFSVAIFLSLLWRWCGEL